MKAFVVVGMAFLFASAAWAQGPNVPPVEELMEPDIFRQTGLHKLTSDELANLNQWLGVFAATVLDVYGSGSTSGGGTSDVVESRINGEFEGWEGDTIFELQNGQVWQQEEYAYLYHYAYSPRVLIVDNGGSYVMQVEGVEDTIRVRRIR